MSTRIDLLRHGETERGGGFRGSLDDALTAHGWQQMRDAVALAGLGRAGQLAAATLRSFRPRARRRT